MKVRNQVRRRLQVVAFVATCVFSLVGNLATNTVDVDWRWWPLVTWGSTGLLLLVTVLLQFIPVLSDESAGAVPTLLAGVKRQSVDKVVARRLRNPAPINLRWSSTDRDVAASRHVVLNEDRDSSWQTAPLSGDIGQMADAFLGRLPHRQLVVLGGPGAGKSVLAMLFTLDVANRYAQDGLVPVLLPIGSWNPALEDIEEFITRRISEDYPELAGAGSELTQLISTGNLLPVLDGLDELPVVWQGKALDRLESWTVAARPLVLTCRSVDYHTATDCGAMLSTAAVVEIEPVTSAQVITFLSEPPTARARWQPVLDKLDECPTGLLARVLSSPLMASIARTAYRARVTDPSVLLRFDNQELLTKHLFEAYLADACSDERPASADPTAVEAKGQWLSRRHRWLTFVAFQMARAGTRDWEWQRLTPQAPTQASLLVRLRAVSTLSLSVIVTTGILALLGLPIPIWFLCLVVAISLLAVAFFSSDLRRPPITYWLAGLVIATTAAVTFGGILAAVSNTGWRGFTNSMVAIGGLAMIDYLVTSLHTTWGVASLKQKRLNRNLRVCTVFACVFLLGALTVKMTNTGGAGALAVTSYALLFLSIRALRSPKAPANRHFIPWPGLTALRHRASVAGLLNGLVAGCLMAIAAAVCQPEAVGTAGLVGMVIAGTFSAYLAGLREWLRFRAAHFGLALLGWLPWRLRHFLQDAHARDLLRPAGVVWQFRHALLQDHLAEPLLFARLEAIADSDAYVADYAKVRLASLMAKNGQIDEAIWLLDRVARGHEPAACYAARQLPMILADCGKLTELRALTDDRSVYLASAAALRLSDVLDQQSRPEDAIDVLRAALIRDSDESNVATQLAQLLARHNRLDELQALASGVGEGATAATVQLANTLVELGRPDEALVVLRARLDRGPKSAGKVVILLAKLLARKEQVDEAVRLLEERAGVDESAAKELTAILSEHGRLDELHKLADGHTSYSAAFAARLVADTLVRQGELDQAINLMRVRVTRDEVNYEQADRVIQIRLEDHMASTKLLADLLVQNGRAQEAVELLSPHANDETATYGRRRWQATRCLVDVLIDAGKLDEAVAVLRSRVDQASPYSADAAEFLDEILKQTNRG
ncbi:tetratricopeptide repeat protein [Amycolatopsis sp. NPDC088138]|uniref:tetratricopeptide repeat protein n=1 Tax=Amycolatopsis sp. NPDC088138 TaxID=3363938 RepID=UPI003807B3E5